MKTLEMIYTKIRPAYMEQFCCKASACTDSCCMHWEIDIDPDTLQIYKSVEGPFGERLRAGITETSEGASFILDEKERCPFLNKHNLCDIYLELGEEWLCGICTEHPRFYNWLSDGEFAGVGLACEAAAELILDPAVSDELLKETVVEKILTEEEETIDYEPEIEEVLQELFRLFLQVDTCVEKAGKPMDSEKLKTLLSAMQTWEINSPAWSVQLADLKDKVEPVQENVLRFLETVGESANGAERYRRLFRYFIYRHFPAAHSGDYEGVSMEDSGSTTAAYAEICTRLILLLQTKHWMDTGKCTLWDTIEIVKLFSQEIEYDTDNVALLMQAAQDMQL